MRAFLLFAILACAAPSAWAQMLPVTTSSEEARRHFLEARNDAFFWQTNQAHRHLDAALAADSTFVLAYLHRAGTAPRSQRQPYIDFAETYRTRVSEGEQQLMDAFNAFLIEGDQRHAIEILQDLDAVYPDDPYLAGYLGMRYFNLGEYAEAAQHFAQALERDSEFYPAYNLMGWAAMHQEDYETAQKHFQESLRLMPGEPRPYESLGQLYLSMEQYEEAAAEFERVLELDPDFNGSWTWHGRKRNDLGQTYLEAGRNEEAERVFRENIYSHPDEPRTYDALGGFYLRMGRYDEAIAQFEKALASDPAFSLSRDNLARARMEQGKARFEEAFANQDADALAALYTEDAVLFTRHSAPTTGGRAGIRAYWTDFFDLGYDDISLTTVELRDAGAVIYESGIATVRQVGEVGLVADYMTIWKQTPEGWKIQYDIKFRTSGGPAMVHAADVEWTELIPGVSFAAVYGDWQAEAHGKLIRFAPGAAAPLHTHTHPYRGVMLEGRLTNPYVGEDDPAEMGPGDAWFVPGGVPHGNTCVSEEPCLFYTYGDAHWDIQVVEQ